MTFFGVKKILFWDIKIPFLAKKGTFLGVKKVLFLGKKLLFLGKLGGEILSPLKKN